MRPLTAFACVAATCLAMAPDARSSDPILMPAYAPNIGKEMAYHTQFEILYESQGAASVPRTTMHGELRRRVTVTGREGDRISMVWRFDADVPAGASSSPTGRYLINDGFRKTYGLYRIAELAVEATAAGAPARIHDYTRIRANLLDSAQREAGPGPLTPEQVLGQLLARLDADPSHVALVLLPEISALTRAQRGAAQPLPEVGASWATERIERSLGSDVRMRGRMSIERIDRNKRTVTFAWSEEADPAEFAEASRAEIDQEIEAIRERDKIILGDWMATLRRAWRTDAGRATVSLRDGSTIEAEETVATQLGAKLMQTTIRTRRMN